MTRGKAIRIFLIDGDADGRWQAEHEMRPVRAYKIPRTLISKSKEIEDLQKPAVYFLIGDDETGESRDGKRVYIGETENPSQRFIDHLSKKDWWYHAIVLVSTNEFLNKARVKYLESRLLEIAINVNRYDVHKGKESNAARLPDADIAGLEDYIDDVKLLLPTLGAYFLEPYDENKAIAGNDGVVGEKDTDVLLYLRKAVGKPTSEGFLVLKGAAIAPIVKSAGKSIIKVREKYSKLIVDGMLTEDVQFGSPSTAAGFVSGSNINGRIEWKTANGKSLKDIEESEN